MECINIKKLITFCLLLISISVFAQKKIEVTGIVTDENKEPLIGVNVTVKDQAGLGAITDINGRYKINVEEYSRLLFSYIGFDKQEIVERSWEIGTYDTSVLPYEDCCTIFVAKHPVTKPNLNVIRKSEEKLAEKIDELMEAALSTAEVIEIQ